MNNIQEIEKMDFNKNTIDLNSNYNITNKFQKKIKFSKSQNNFNNKNTKNLKKIVTNNENKSLNKEKKGLKINHGALFYYKGKNLTEINSTKNLTNKKIIFKNNNSDIENILPLNNINTYFEPTKNAKSERKSKERKNNIIKKIKKEKINNTNDELVESKLSKIRKEKESRNNHNINEDLSMSESCISNINNSINTFSTTNEKNNSLNSININNANNNKIGKFNLFENSKEHNDKIINELASDLEQSTVKGNEIASNKKKIEENFKSICNKIQPVNLKLNNQTNLEKIEEYVDKNNNMTNKSEQNTTIFSHNINNNIEVSNNSNSINILGRNNKLKELIELTEKLEENSIKSNRSNYSIKNNKNTENNINLDKRMNVYDKKLGDLELFMKEQILEIIKQITLIKNNYMFISNILKKENNNLNPFKLKEYNTITNSHSKVNIFNKSNTNSNNIGFNNNENKNSLNFTTNYFYKKTPTIEINSKLSSNSKREHNHNDVNLSDNLFYNGNYYFNIKDILGKKKDKNNINYYFDNKKLLKTFDNNKFLNEKTNNKNNI